MSVSFNLVTVRGFDHLSDANIWIIQTLKLSLRIGLIA